MRSPRLATFALMFVIVMTGCPWPQKKSPTKASNPAATLANVKWSIWHQGAIVWANGGNSDQFVDAGTAFVYLVNVQSGDGKTELLQAGPDNVYQILPTAISQCVSEHHDTFVGDMRWVCYHQNRIDPIVEAVRTGQFTSVRQQYWNQESFDDNKSNVASCFNGTALTQVVEQACGYQP
jgi:hypothetical protein